MFDEERKIYDCGTFQFLFAVLLISVSTAASAAVLTSFAVCVAADLPSTPIGFFVLVVVVTTLHRNVIRTGINVSELSPSLTSKPGNTN